MHQDKNPKHTSRTSKEELKQEKDNVLEWHDVEGPKEGNS